VSILFSQREASSPEQHLSRSARDRRRGNLSQANRVSAVWACRRLRADLISTMPIDVYRKAAGVQFPVATPPVLESPDGEVDVTEWMYSSQFDIDGHGNTFGLIREVDALGLPRRIELQPVETCSVRMRKGVKKYVFGGKEYDPKDVWHERQFTVSGLPVGLSPLAHAAMTIGQYTSAQEFALDWFSGAGIPAARLKNTARRINDGEARKVKERFKESVRNGDLFVHGSDWDYEMIAVKASETQFLEAMGAGLRDICRFLGVPGDMVDVETSTGTITYANVTQRNLQLLVMNLQPAIYRRERALSTLTAKPRFVKLNTDAGVMRMDPKSRADLNEVLLRSKQRTVTEVREKDDLPPYTDEQIAEIQAMTTTKATEPVPVPGGKAA
jgi:HK97 family phage portal protein